MAPHEVPVLEIGGTHVSAARVDVGQWNVVDGTLARFALDAAGTADSILATLTEAGRSLRVGDGAVWGVAIPGPFDYVRGIADYRGVAKFDALRGVDLGAVLGRTFAAHFHFLNDAEAFTVGEWLSGAARGHDRVIGVTLGTGVGSAFLVDGRAQEHGPGVAPQGRLDLVDIDGRPLEDTVSRRAIIRRYRELGGSSSDVVDVREIAELARAGDACASAAMAEPLQALGRVLAPLALDFEARVLVVGGSISLAWDIVEPALRSGMDEISPQWFELFHSVPSRLPDDAALIGAARQAVLRESRDPGPG